VHADKNLEAAFVSVVSDGQRLFSAFEKPNFGFEVQSSGARRLAGNSV
jgi:hypothetical protein